MMLYALYMPNKTRTSRDMYSQTDRHLHIYMYDEMISINREQIIF